MGGSQGSGALNGAVAPMLDATRTDRRLAIRHVVGERFLADAAPALDGHDGVVYQPVGYEADMPSDYAAADLLIGRGGASTVHEVAVTGIPAVLVRWAGSAEDHQTLTVAWLSDADAAVHLPESEISRLGEIVDRLRHDPDRCAALGANASAMGEVHRSGALAELIESVAQS